MNHESIIKKECAEFFQISPDQVSMVTRLMGGMSNYTYVVQAGEETVTFRIPGKNAENFVDRKIEAYHLKLIEPLNLNNQTLHVDLEKGYKIARMIEGQPLHELNPYDFLSDAAKVLKKVHQSNLKSTYDYDPFGRLEKYQQLVRDFGYQHTERFNSYKAILENHRPFLESFPKVLTHGDSQVSNFVATKNALRLMDWEFTGMNDAFYDIACFGNTNFDHARALLPVYLDREPNEEDYNRLYLWRTFQCLQWHNVALYKAFIGLSEALNIDFEKVATLYLDKAEALLKKLN